MKNMSIESQTAILPPSVALFYFSVTDGAASSSAAYIVLAKSVDKASESVRELAGEEKHVELRAVGLAIPDTVDRLDLQLNRPILLPVQPRAVERPRLGAAKKFRTAHQSAARPHHLKQI